MKLPRRRFLHLAAGAAALPAVSRMARAQAYPSRPVRIIVGFPAGGTADILTRLLGQWLSERLGQQFLVENRPGAAGNLAAEAVIRSAADGYTLYYASSPNAISASLYENLKFNFLRDMTPVASIGISPLVLEVHPSVPVKTVPELIAYAKANSNKLSMASNGNGSTSHLSGELFKMMASVSMVHVPYRGAAPALTDLVGGQVQVMFDILVSSIEHIRAGKLRALAVTGAARTELLPDVPTVADFLPGYEAILWGGFTAPVNTPVEIVMKLNREINAGLGDAKMKARLAELGATPLALAPNQFGKLIADDTDKWAKVVKFSGAKVD